MNLKNLIFGKNILRETCYEFQPLSFWSMNAEFGGAANLLDQMLNLISTSPEKSTTIGLYIFYIHLNVSFIKT